MRKWIIVVSAIIIFLILVNIILEKVFDEIIEARAKELKIEYK